MLAHSFACVSSQLHNSIFLGKYIRFSYSITNGSFKIASKKFNQGFPLITKELFKLL